MWEINCLTLYTYLESEVKVREVGIVSCLEHVAFEVDICHFIKLKDLLLVNLFEGVSVSVELYKRDSAI